MTDSYDAFYSELRNRKYKILRKLYSTECDLSIILPTYNEADIINENLHLIKNKIDDMDIDAEIIIADDGSTDETVEIAENCHFVDKVVKLPHAGKGNAIRSGILSAHGSFKIFYDVDLPFGLDILDRLLYHLMVQEHDVVAGIRDNRNKSGSYGRAFSSEVYNFIVNRIVIAGIEDVQCGLKGFSTPAASSLFEVCKLNGFAFDVEILYVAWKKHMSIFRMPVKLEKLRPNRIKIKRVAPRMFVDLFRIKINHLRGAYK